MAGKLIGLVTDPDLKPFTPSGSYAFGGLDPALVLRRIKVSDVMSQAPVTVPMDYTVEETAETMLNNEVPGVVVVDQSHRPLGVFTEVDTNRVLLSMTGHRRGGDCVRSAYRGPAGLHQGADGHSARPWRAVGQHFDHLRTHP